MDERSSRPRLAEIRTAELEAACEILGVDRQEFLDYRDSGMTGAAGNHDSGSFLSAPLQDTRERVAAVLREERPDVVVTYARDGTYGHPDHHKAHTTTMAALELLKNEGWQPTKMYVHVVPRSVVETVVDAARRADIPFPEGLAQIQGVPDDEITTLVDVSDVLDRKLAACVAHRSQMHPGLALATMAAQVFETAFGTESFVLVGGELGGERPEPSLFAGL